MHNFLKTIRLAIANGHIDSGEEICAAIAHNAWCAMRNHLGECNCNPDIDITRNGRVLRMKADGSLTDTGSQQ